MALHADDHRFDIALPIAEAFVRTCPDAAMVLAPTGEIIAANDVAACIFERTENELLDMRVADLLGEDEVSRHMFEETEDGPITCLQKRRDGQEFAVEMSVRPFDAGGIEYYAVTERDLDRCFDAQDELRLARLALDAAWDSVIMHRPDGELVYFNNAAASDLGYSREEFEARGVWAWTGSDDLRIRDQRLEELRTAGELSFIARTEHRNGTEMFLDVHSRWLETPNGPLVVSVSRDVTDKMQAQEILREMAFHDPLTGLPNRALLDDRLEVAISEARRHGDLLGIAYLDIDDFKPVNDSFGHEVGDRVLEQVGKRLGSLVRDHDTVARMGGDEFVAVFTRLGSEADLGIAAQKLLDAISSPINIEGISVVLNASCGLAMFDAREDDERSLLMKADLAMYDAKRGAHMTFRDKVNGAAGRSRDVQPPPETLAP